MKFLKIFVWLALAGVLLLPACSASKPTLMTQPAAMTAAARAVRTATSSESLTPLVEATEETAIPGLEGGAATVESTPGSAYPAPGGEAEASGTPYLILPQGEYPAPGAEVPAAAAPPSAQPGSPYPAPGGSQPATAGPSSSPSPSAGSSLPAITATLPPPSSTQEPQAGSPYPAPNQAPTNPAAASTPNQPPTVPYPGPVQGITQSPAATASPGITQALPPSPSRTASPSTQRAPTGGTASPTPVPTGTLYPTTPPVIRVMLMATDPLEVRLDAGKLQLVEFFAYWSPLSKSMASVVHLLEDRYEGSIQFTYLDVDNPLNARFKKALGYQYAPHFFLLDGQGEVLKQWKGYVSSETLEAEFAAQGVTP